MDVEQNVVPIDDGQNIVLGKVEPIKTEPLETVPVSSRGQRLDIPVTSVSQFSQLQAGKSVSIITFFLWYFQVEEQKPIIIRKREPSRLCLVQGDRLVHIEESEALADILGK